MKRAFPAALFVAATLLTIPGCRTATSGSSAPTVDRGDPQPAAELAQLSSSSPNEYTAFFLQWFSTHQEKGAVTRGATVEFPDKKVVFAARTFGGSGKLGSFQTEVEFLTALPDGRIIQDFVAGMGETAQAAREDALNNFTLTTSHVLYSAFVNDRDVHLPAKTVTVHGKPRLFFVGDAYTRTQNKIVTPIDTIGRYTIEQLSESLPDDTQAHWAKVVYAMNDGKIITASAQIDGKDAPDFDTAMKKAPWPKPSGFYMYKQFILIR